MTGKFLKVKSKWGPGLDPALMEPSTKETGTVGSQALFDVIVLVSFCCVLLLFFSCYFLE